ncbi:hypothetical protein ASH01_17790 [Terrabacter sp. Soil811]|uniref:S8 family serine peptidase n=1 Tax=Terrabacter sp. Soil811 TaxID=1736419 RepID=UPI0006F5B518|nr:S8 family serine peptidase [Terrabacter sp. Soil811]KRF42659.1 hypothetical protein ASH01_17790 [Terrabacter sp. Soil811]
MSNNDDGSPTPDAPDVRWWRPALPNPAQQARYTDQLRLMIQGLNASLQAEGRGDAALVTAYPDPDNLETTEFLYRADTILVSTDDDDLARISEALGGLSLAPSDADDGRVPPPVGWLRVLPLPPGQPWAGDDVSGTPAETALLAIEAATGRADLAGFDRVVHLTSNSGCPATEPVPASTGPDPALRPDATLGQGVRVAVIDSGWPLAATDRDVEPTPARDVRWSWLDGITHDELETARPGTTVQAVEHGHYRGHGIFVAGVVRAMAPAAQVTLHAWGPTTYGQIESELAPILQRVLETEPDIISMSAGTGGASGTTPVAEPPAGRRRAAASTEPAFALRQFVATLEPTKTLLVCAAGNDGTQGPFEPASIRLPHTHDPRCKVAVGALKKQGRLAKYSNRGTWVDVYARGSKVVNAYPDGPYTYKESPRTDETVQFTTGLAEWSGTSFATPLVAGLVASRMSWTGESPRQAWEALSAVAATQAPYGLATLRPGDADRGVNPPAG